jgi:ABC-2 type transport system ATP-binding protein
MISIKDLKFGYKKTSVLFDGLKLNTELGNIYGLLGRNGAGKTTLLYLMCGLLKPGKGDLSVLGYTPAQRKPGFLSKAMLVPEKISLPQMPLKTYIAIHSVFYPGFDLEYMNKCLDEFEVNKEVKLTDMSFGQQKKFMIAFAFASMCPIVFLDEPTNGLDIPSKTQFRKMLINAATEERTFVISTHQVRDLENLIDPIIILEDGKIIFNQSLENVENKLVVYNTRDKELLNSALYYTKSLKGYSVVAERSKIDVEDESFQEIDLESLFNIVIQNPDRIQGIFWE